MMPGNPAFGSTVLRIPAEQSPNFVKGVSGWFIGQDGSAEFNDLTVIGPTVSESLTFTTGDGSEITLLYSDISGAVTLSVTGTAGKSAFNLAIPVTLSGAVTILAPSGDTTGAADSAAIGKYLAAGTAVLLLPGTWYLSAPIAMPDQSGLIGVLPSWGIPTGNYGAGGLPLQGAVIRAGSAFAGAALITMGSAGTTQHGGQRLEGITLSGTGAPAGTHGILSQGYVGGVKMRDVVVWGMPGDGLLAENDGTGGHNPDFWQLWGCKFSNCGAWGVNLTALSDSWFTGCESTGNTTGGWSIANGADTRFTACRGSSNRTGDGWSLTGLAGFTGTITMTACEADLNATGIAVSGSGTGTLILNGTYAKGNTTAAWSYAGTMNIESNAAWNTSTAAPTLS